MSDTVINALDDIRDGVKWLDSQIEDSVAQIAPLLKIRAAADVAIRDLQARGLSFLDADLKEYDEVRRESQAAAEGDSNDEEIRTARAEADSLFAALDLALRLLGKDGLE